MALSLLVPLNASASRAATGPIVDVDVAQGTFASGSVAASISVPVGAMGSSIHLLGEQPDGLCLNYEGSGSGEATIAYGSQALEFTDVSMTVDTLRNAVVAKGKWQDADGENGTFLVAGSLHGDVGAGCGETSRVANLVSVLVTDGGLVVEDLLEQVPELAELVERAPDVSDLLDLVDVVPSQDKQSDLCELNGGDRMVDSTNLGVRTFVYTHQPSIDQLWVCARVEDTTTGEGYGGRLEATPTNAAPSVSGGPGAPSTDGDSAACTLTTDPPNEVPAPHPISSGGVATVDYMLDAYVNDSQAWLCLHVGGSDYRVKVPLGAGNSGVSAGTAATWHPDEGTPTL